LSLKEEEEEEEEERIEFAGPKPFCSAKPACFKSSLDNSLTFLFLWHLHLPRSGVDLFFLCYYCLGKVPDRGEK
jgi:hypothetical protein